MFQFFKDRRDASKKLAGLLKYLKGQKVVVYALPRGGVVVAEEIAKILDINKGYLAAEAEKQKEEAELENPPPEQGIFK